MGSSRCASHRVPFVHHEVSEAHVKRMDIVLRLHDLQRLAARPSRVVLIVLLELVAPLDHARVGRVVEQAVGDDGLRRGHILDHQKPACLRPFSAVIALVRRPCRLSRDQINEDGLLDGSTRAKRLLVGCRKLDGGRADLVARQHAAVVVGQICVMAACRRHAQTHFATQHAKVM